MQTYISFLRGVNMTGHNSIKMTDLSALYKNLGFSDPETYIQSGNVIFSSVNELAVPDIAFKIEKAILERFEYYVPAYHSSISKRLSYVKCMQRVGDRQ